MKVLTLTQPWASLIKDGIKKIETRSWQTTFRGVIAIHASKKVDIDACRRFGYDHSTIITGAIICTAILVDIVRFPHRGITPDIYGDFSDGRYGWILENVEPIEPIEARGYQFLWEFGTNTM